MSIGYWNISCLSEVYQWCFQSTKADFILGRHGRGRPQKLWNRGPLECDHPKDRPLPVLTLWDLHRNLPWQRKQPLLRWTFIKRGRTHTHTEIHMQTLAVNPALAHLSLTLMVRVKENVNLSTPSDLQNVLGLSYRTALSARCQINSHIILSVIGENN